MRIVEDPDFDAKSFVAQGYDRCAEAYARARDRGMPAWLHLLTDRLPPGIPILDIGCGSGVPALAGHFRITGVDISATQLALARHNMPDATLLLGDIMEKSFAPESFGAVVSLYTLFHLPRREHGALFAHIYEWLRPDGLFLVSLGNSSEPGYIEEFFGIDMYWSHFDAPTYDVMLEKCGFKILHRERLSHGYDESEQCQLEVHPLVLARRLRN
jgi:SAM-dependent methyltransferase